MKSKEKIINDYEKYIKFIIKKLGLGYLYDELYDVALIGFTQAINNFDESKNIKITTFIFECVKNEVCKELKNINEYRNKLKIRSLNEPISVGSDEELQDFIPFYEHYEKKLFKDEIMYVINRKLSFLNERDQTIFNHLYGLNGHKQMNSIELEKKYNTTRQNIQRIKIKILNQLKNVTKEYLENYMEGLYDKED